MRCLSSMSNIGVGTPSFAVERKGKVRLVKVTCRLGLMIFLLTSGTLSTFSQEAAPSPTPSEEELKLKEEKRLLELRRDIEQAKKAIRDAQPQPPTPSATPLAGDTTLDQNVKLEAEMVSDKAMSAAAKDISKEIRARVAKATTISVYDAQTVKDWRFYQALSPALQGQVKDIKEQYQQLLDLSVTVRADQNVRESFTGAADISSAFGAGTTLLKSFVDLTALFRTDTKIEGKSVTIDKSALVGELFRALKNDYAAITLYYPEVFPPRKPICEGADDAVTPPPEHCVQKKFMTVTIIGDLFNYKKLAEQEIETNKAAKEVINTGIASELEEMGSREEELTQVGKLKARKENLTTALGKEKVPLFRRKLWEEIVEVEAQLGNFGGINAEAMLEARISRLAELIRPKKAQIKQLDSEIKQLADLNQRFQDFVDEFVKVDANGVNALSMFIRAEDIEHAMTGDESYWLEIKSVAAGVNNRVRKNFLRYFSGAKVDHSGGVIVEYTLYNKAGAVIYSDKVSVYGGYFEPKKIKDPQKFKDAVN